MKAALPLGELEHLLLLAILQLGEEARAIRIREQLAARAGRRVARGALYGTLARLHEKGFLEWQVDPTTPERGGIPRRCFRVTETGLEAVRRAQSAIANLSENLEGALGER